MELQIIQNKIYEIRGCKVMLDFDLAEMYQVETKNLKRAVRHNIERFPDDFLFEITKDEWESLRCNFCTSNTEKGRGGIRYMPFAFTEQGVAMLSSVLNSKFAIAMNVIIIRAFVAIRQMVLNHKPVSKVEELENRMQRLEKYIEEVFTDYNDINEDTRVQLELINQALAELQVKHKQADEPRKKIGFDYSKKSES